MKDAVFKGPRNMTLCLAVLTGLLVVDCRVTCAGDPILIAHRGLLRHAPENTLPTFAACLALGIGFELDIRTTKDGQATVPVRFRGVRKLTEGKIIRRTK